MTKKRFELIPNPHGQLDIIDHVESEEKNAICIYNDLGVLPFSSAPSLCDLLNILYEENQLLKKEKERGGERMTEKKRFEVKHNIPYGSNHYGIIDNVTGKKYSKSKYDSQQLCDEINKIVNENKDLKFENEKKYRKIRQLEQMLQDVER